MDRYAGASLQDLRILIVEDNRQISTLIARLLRDAGAIIVGPASTVEAALALADSSLNCAVLDYWLRQGDIRPIARRLEALNVPYVIQTGDLAAIPAELRHVPILAKPIVEQDLIRRLAELARK